MGFVRIELLLLFKFQVYLKSRPKNPVIYKEKVQTFAVSVGASLLQY